MTPSEYKAACDATGHSPEILAGLLGVSRATIFRRWQGIATITPEMAMAIRSVPKAKKKPPKI
jgi:plasmid maintenance system antidote protein VapI